MSVSEASRMLRPGVTTLPPREERNPFIAPDRTALVLVEFQQQWTEPGLYRRIIAAQLDGRAVIETARAFTADARRAGVTVIHAPLVLDPENKRGAFAHITRARVFRKGSPRAALTEGLWANGDILVSGRTAFDAFVNSTLKTDLRSHGLDTLLVTGFTTDQCVAKTMRTAIAQGFQTWLLGDCCAAPLGWLQRRTERRFKERLLTIGDARRALSI
jgi:nicotinamidase-related amidase